MKIRIQGNSVRFRLTRPEVEALGTTGSYQEKTMFSNKSFSYQVTAKSEINELDISFENDNITLYIPEKDARDWPSNKVVGFEKSIALQNGGQLHLLIEKDFVCLDQPIADQQDHYPNPKAAN